MTQFNRRGAFSFTLLSENYTMERIFKESDFAQVLSYMEATDAFYWLPDMDEVELQWPTGDREVWVNVQ